MLIDTHAHLNDHKFKNILSEVINRAQKEQVKKIIVVGWDEASSRKAIELAHHYSFIYAAVGFHPENLKNIDDESLRRIKELAQDEKVVAIGEIGLDYYWSKDENSRLRQREYFVKQIHIANEIQKPIIVHSREASLDTYNILRENIPTYQGVMHCYSGSKEMALQYIELGLYISLAGPVTFKNAKTPKEVAEVVPLEWLLIETDCPYLAPHPYRGQLNECSLIPLVAKEISAIKKLSLEEVAQQTSANAERLFKI
ncbi:MAG: TatD family hydrolase [Bacilli bacterium]|jgi:TatD DNase family protein